MRGAHGDVARTLSGRFFARVVYRCGGVSHRLAISVAGAAFLSIAASTILLGCPGGDLGNVGTATCLTCHNGTIAPAVPDFASSPHAEEGCEACHGPGYWHVRNAGRGGAFIIRYTGDVPKTVALCSRCHAEQVEGYQASVHALNAAASCTNCHDVHSGETTPPDACMACHSHQVTSFIQSNHAVLGGLSCGDCHNLHAAAPSDLSDICEQCHASQVDGYRQSVHGLEGGANCLDCHPVHEPASMWPSYTDNEVCLQCHGVMGFDTVEKVEAHTHHDVDPEGPGSSSRCIACHLAPLEREDQANGPHSHTFAPVPPIASNEAVDNGITPAPPNSCAGRTGCHDGTVRTAPLFPVDDPSINEMLQLLYNNWFGE